MSSLFLTREQYDSLFVKCPNWMDLRWREYTKQWNINGVRVFGSQSAIENLKAQLV